MTRDHELIDELLAVRALGGLDGEDVATLERELAVHGDCQECRRLEAAHLEVAAALAASLDPRPVDPAIADRIVAAGREAALPATPRTPDDLAARRDRRLARWQAAFGAAAAVALVLAVVLMTRSDDRLPRLSSVVGFDGGAGQLAAAYDPGSSGLVLVGTGIPDPGPGSVYELWLFHGDAPVRAACLRPTDGSLAAFVDADVAGVGLMAVTVEDPSCPEAPTTDPIYTAELA
jgi:anti-sigma-K factor RskA